MSFPNNPPGLHPVTLDDVKRQVNDAINDAVNDALAHVDDATLLGGRDFPPFEIGDFERRVPHPISARLHEAMERESLMLVRRRQFGRGMGALIVPDALLVGLRFGFVYGIAVGLLLCVYGPALVAFFARLLP